MSKNELPLNRHNAETALINALALLRNGDTEQALRLTVIAVGRIGALVPAQVLKQVGQGIGDQIVETLGAPVG